MKTPRWGTHPDLDGVAEETSPSGQGWGGWVGLFYAGIWLIFLVDPIGEAWTRIGTLQGQIGLTATLVYVVAYLWHFLAGRAIWGHRERWFREPAGPRLARYAVQVVLAMVVLVTLGQSAMTVWVFVAISGLWTWSMRAAFTIAAAIVVGYELLLWHFADWQHDQSVLLGLVLGMAAVAGGMVASSRSEALSQARQENARLAVQEERNRMSRDLHDILGHSLTVITVKAELAGRLMESSPERARAEVADLERLSRDALADVRRAVEGYREISLSGELARAREALSAAGVQASLPSATDDVPSDLRELFAWVVREGVTNVIRHSDADHCSIALHAGRLAITDDGRGRTAGSTDGHGLEGARERASRVGAVLTAHAVSPHGFELTVTSAQLPGDGTKGAGSTAADPAADVGVVAGVDARPDAAASRLGSADATSDAGSSLLPLLSRKASTP